MTRTSTARRPSYRRCTVINEGFYYDIFSERPFTPEDMAAIEKRMAELIATEYDVVKKMTPRAEVIELFSARGEDYKLRRHAQQEQHVPGPQNFPQRHIGKGRLYRAGKYRRQDQRQTKPA